MTPAKKLELFRKIGLAEGISFLVLLGISMPLKYWLNFPQAVTINGWLHGILFIAFLVMAWEMRTDLKKDFKWFVLAGIAALVPLGTFYFDKQLKKEKL